MTAASEWPLDAVLRLRDGQRSEVWVANAADGSTRLVYADQHDHVAEVRGVADGRR
jgi:hypothetical protein